MKAHPAALILPIPVPSSFLYPITGLINAKVLATKIVMIRVKHLYILIICLIGFIKLKAQDLTSIGKQKPFAINGTLGLGLGTYSVNGIPARQRDFTYILNGSPTLSIYGISFPFSVVVSDQQRSYTQPFNQYGISPNYKWMTLHAGWRSLEFSPFSLVGHNFLGGGIELNPGKLRFGFVYGRFNKAIEEDIHQSLAIAQQPAYKRMGYSVKLGLGTEKNHFDVIFLKGKDQVNSLSRQPSSIPLAPAENSVLAISSKFSFLKHFVLDIDASGSLYTRNVMDTLENLRLGKYDFIKNIITLNASSSLSTAAQTSLAYNSSNYAIKAKYRRIDPDYNSMGAYYFETDVENYTIETAVRLFKSQLQLGGSFGLQYDDILHDKEVRSKRKIGSANVAFNKQHYGIDLRYTNYGITQDRGINPALDRFRVARTNHNLSSVFRYTVNSEQLSQSFVLVGNLQSLVDLNEYTKPNSQSNSKTANLSYQISFLKKLLNLNANINYTRAEVVTGNIIFYGPTIGASQSFLKGNLNLGASLSYQLQENNQVDIGRLLNGNLSTSYRLGKRNALNLSVNYLNNNSKDIMLPSFNELRTNFGMVHSF